MTTAERFEQAGPDRLEQVDLRPVLASILALHSPPDPRRFPELMAAECDRLFCADHADLRDLRAAWEDRSDHEREPRGALRPRPDGPVGVGVSAAGRRLTIAAAASRRVFVLSFERYLEPFRVRERRLAEALRPHLGPAFDHARLRAAEWDVGEAISGLTVREQEVLALVADGRTNRQIGLALFIEPRTVEKHVEHIRTKLGARSRAEAAAKWARAVAVPV